MNWRTGARIGVAVIGLAVAAAVFVNSRNGPPAPALPPEAPKLDPDVSLLGGEGKIIRYRDGKPSVELTSRSTTNLIDGRARFEDARIKGLGENAFTLRGKVIETKGPAVPGENPTQFSASGHFAFESSDGMVVESDQGTYDDATGVMEMPGAVRFTRGRISGTATGARYDRDTNTISLLEAATADVAADADGRGAARATASAMKLMRGQHALQMEGNARIVGDVQTASARTATVTFTDDESAMKFLDLRGAARVTPAATAAPGQPMMSADGITMSFQPDGLTMQHATLTGRAVMSTKDATGARSIRASWIDVFTGADGRTVTALKARDSVVVEIPATETTSARSITSTTLTATGDDKAGLTSARFEGNPCFQEDASKATRGGAAAPVDPNACTPAGRAAARAKAGASGSARRVGTATTLVLKLAGQLDAIQEAEFQQKVIFEDGGMSAEADLATYDDAKDKLLLKPGPREPRRQPTVDTGDMTVTANEIDLFLESEDVTARGAVKTRAVRKAEPGRAAAGSLFEDGEPAYGTAETFNYVKATGKATYTGSARTRATLKQGTTDITAIRLDFTQSSNGLFASGQVDSRVLMTGPPPDPKQVAKPQTYHVQADTLTYDDARRTAVYDAPRVVLTMDDGSSTEARRLTFELARESRTLESMRAEGAGDFVFATLSGGNEVRGDLLVYSADTDVYVVTGKTARVKSPDKGGECKRTESTTLELNRKTGMVQLPARSMAPSQTVPMPCSESLRPIHK